MYQNLATTRPKARKPHRCDWCGEWIPAREQYVQDRGVWEDRIQVFHMHAECWRALLQLAAPDEGFDPYQMARGCCCERGRCECGKNNSGDAARKD